MHLSGCLSITACYALCNSSSAATQKVTHCNSWLSMRNRLVYGFSMTMNRPPHAASGATWTTAHIASSTALLSGHRHGWYGAGQGDSTFCVVLPTFSPRRFLLQCTSCEVANVLQVFSGGVLYTVYTPGTYQQNLFFPIRCHAPLMNCTHTKVHGNNATDAYISLAFSPLARWVL